MGKGDVKINGNRLNQIIFESVKKILKEYWTDADTALENATKEAEAELVQKFIVWAEQHKGERTSPVRRVFFGDETEGDSAEIDGNEFYWYKLVNVPGEWRVEWWQVPGRLTNEKGNWVGAWTNYGPGKEMGLKEAILGLYSDYSEEADNTVRLNESQLRNLIRESVRNVLMEMDEISKDKVMPGKYMQIFKNRIENAMACSEDIRKTVADFYRDFRNRIPNEAFTIGNLMDIADGIGTYGYRTHETGDMPDGHKIKDAEGWWGMNAGKFLEEDSNDFEYKDAYVDNRTGNVIQSRRGKDGRKHYRTTKAK